MSKPAKHKTMSASGVIKTGPGALRGVFISSVSGSPTLRFVNGDDANDETANVATSILTVSGAIVPAAHATNTITSDATNVADGATVVIGAITYRFKDTMLAAYDVKIGASAAISLDNLKAAINATGTPGTEYFLGTLAHPFVYASTNTDTTQKVVARIPGTESNALATTETSTHLAWADTTLGGGTGASDPGVAATAATVTIADRTYTFVNELSETSGAAAVADQVLWGGNTATALDNLKVAINAGATAGTNYSTGTVAHASVNATTNTDTAQTIEADTAGNAGNLIATSETLTNGSWTGTFLAGGSDANDTLIPVFTPVAASGYTFVGDDGLAFTEGLYLELGATCVCTVFFD